GPVPERSHLPRVAAVLLGAALLTMAEAKCYFWSVGYAEMGLLSGQPVLLGGLVVWEVLLGLSLLLQGLTPLNWRMASGTAVAIASSVAVLWGQCTWGSRCVGRLPVEFSTALTASLACLGMLMFVRPTTGVGAGADLLDTTDQPGAGDDEMPTDSSMLR
ncbi:MAG: hypothetical protein ACF8TS_17295, partial [Maioricimonas sp. JB049]